MNLIDAVHSKYIFSRRVSVLSRAVAQLIPPNSACLDVGCGDGTIDSIILGCRTDLAVRGIDVLVRPETRIPVVGFDGRTIPFPDNHFDVVIFVDVLHHTGLQRELLAEAARVSRKYVVIKDHLLDGFAAEPILRYMDRRGNERFGVRSTYNYLSKNQWNSMFSELGLQVESWVPHLGLYVWPLSCLFDRSLHFLVRLKKAQMQTDGNSVHTAGVGEA